MGSVNPVILLPAALESRGEEIAKQYAGSITLGAGQFCTNPGLLLAIEGPGLTVFENALASAISALPAATMLTPGIHKNFTTRAEAMTKEAGVSVITKVENSNADLVNQAAAFITKVSAADFLKNPKLHEEVFGPYSLLVTATDKQQLEEVIGALEGQLTVTLMANKEELASFDQVIGKAAAITGRIILNGVPTGVEVCGAMQHGGPFPATTDSRFTSVGTSAVHRFVRPLSWQSWEPSLLPDELKDGNPLNIWRMVDQNWTKN
jgi:alpha-ketoglutaric semialdehyde dehydrogenase